ncbi:MAG: RDD family protein [Hyphomicrobiales bacterium]|nr:RDD family protein [Hyphomicrobiales bacterium]
MSVASHERTTAFLEGKLRTRRQIVTPEGVPLPVEVADYSERLAAFVIDLCIWLLLTITIYLPIVFAFGAAGGPLLAVSIALFIGFLVRNGYFLYFELAWRGSTPGKRRLGLRVIDRHGGPLLASAVVARNLTREVEIFIPFGVLMTGIAGEDGGVDWLRLATGVWFLLFAALPLTNRERLRGGDMIAGTMVIAQPKRLLASDMVQRPAQFTFSERQLRAYGVFELQVLEELLRHPDRPESARVLSEVCDKICHRVGWGEPIPAAQVLTFLREFYTAERAFLEREQLFGKVRTDKNAEPAGG